MLPFYNKKQNNSFHISIGEEGIVVAYCCDGANKARLFVRSPEAIDTEKLKQLMSKDKDAPIFLYLDTLDQSYVQRTIPTVGTGLGVASLAKNRMEKEVPKNHLKSCIQLVRLPSGRKDYIYTFISAPVEAPLTGWLEFFLPYLNVIQGIYLLPVELYSIIQKLKNIQEANNALSLQHNAKHKLSFKHRFLSLFHFLKRKNPTEKNARWELFLSQNKTGGFRQVAFYDGKVVFSRLLNNISHPDDDVVAGNIEQEIANSVEYLVRLSLSSDDTIDMYLVLASEIQKYIRIEKLKANRVFQYTPTSLAEELELKDAAGEKDKFSDPPILTCLSVAKRKITLHTPITQIVCNYTKRVSFIKYLMTVLCGFLFVMMLTFISSIFGLSYTVYYSLEQANIIKNKIDNNNKLIKETESKIGQTITMDHLNEIADYYKFLTQQYINPIDTTTKLAQILPDIARIKLYKWGLEDKNFFSFDSTGSKTAKLLTLKDATALRNYNIKIEFELLLSNYGKTAEELQKNYLNIDNILRTNFPDYKIEISDLPQIYELQIDVSQPVSLTVKLNKTFDPNPNKTKLPINLATSKIAQSNQAVGNDKSTNENPIEQVQ